MTTMVRVRLSIMVYCDGSGNHARRRVLYPVHIGNRVLVKCELCGIEYRQRAQRFVAVVRALQDHGITELAIDNLPKRSCRARLAE